MSNQQSPRRTALAISAYPPSVGGAQFWAQRLAHELVGLGQSVSVFTQWRTTRNDWVRAATEATPANAANDSDDGIDVHIVGLSGERGLDAPMRALYLPLRPWSARYFEQRLTPIEGSFDAVHVVRVGREHLALAAHDFARKHELPFILTPLHHPRWSRRWWPDHVWRRLYRSADLLNALTNVEANMLVDLGVQQERIQVLGVGAHLTEQAEAPDAVTNETPFLLFLGQQFPYKRLDLAVTAFEAVAKTHTELRLVVAGPPHVKGSECVLRSPQRERIETLGPVSESEKAWLLRNASALIFPSEQESFGGVIVEAAMSFCPVVTGANQQVAEVVKTLKWGTTTNGTTEQVAEAVRNLLDHPPGRDQAATARQSAIKHFSWSALAQKYDQGLSALP